jgi:hypothetical protein
MLTNIINISEILGKFAILYQKGMSSGKEMKYEESI